MLAQVRISYTKFVEKNEENTFYNTFIRLVRSRRTFTYWYQQRYDTNKNPKALNAYSTATQQSFVKWCSKEADMMCARREPETHNITINID